MADSWKSMDLNKFVVKDDMINYDLSNFRSNWQVYDAITNDILDDLLKKLFSSLPGVLTPVRGESLKILNGFDVSLPVSHLLWSSQSFGHQKAINGFDMPLPVAVCSGLVNPLAPRKGNGPNWLFDIDSLTISMKYKPVVVGNQNNGNADSEVPNTEEPRVNQEQDANVNNNNNINTVSLTVSVADIENNVVDENIVYRCIDDPYMPNLEEIVYSDDDE
ncbi:hypothetical protein Tco_0528560 [Tanacetum coccineum]